MARAAWLQGVRGGLQVASSVLSVRLTLLCAVLGGIALTAVALSSPELNRLGALALYCGFVVAPMIWLSSRKG